MENVNQIIAAYDQSPATSGWLSGFRKNRLEDLKKLKVPTFKDEDWKYTRVSAITNSHWQKNIKTTPVDQDLLKPHMIAEFHNLVFVNGQFSSDLSDQKPISGLKIKSLYDLTSSEEENIKSILETFNAPDRENYFRALNQSILRDGLYIETEKSAVITDKLNIIYYNTGNSYDNVSIPSNFIFANENSELAVLETHIGRDEEYFTNYSTGICVSANASVKFYKVQDESKKGYHISHIFAAVRKDARFETFDFSVGSAISRNSLEIKLMGDNAYATLDGLYLTQDGQHIDNHTVVEHLAPHCQSTQYYKGVLDGKSRAVFNGRVIVHQYAQKTNAFQLNKNLLLSKESEIDTKPQLEIDADDVKCSHGATVGQLNEDEIFYLQTRGLTKDAAEKLLSYAYSEEIILRVSDEKIRKAIDSKLSYRVKGNS